VNGTRRPRPEWGASSRCATGAALRRTIRGAAGRVIKVPDMPADAQKKLGLFNRNSPGTI